MKCMETLEENERKEGHQYETLILGGFSGRLDQTVHILSYIYKIRQTRSRVYVITDDNVGWVLDGVSAESESWSYGLESMSRDITGYPSTTKSWAQRVVSYLSV
ncbi:hypothetical protein J3R82DRAFT_11927 [Butyriboletus roseoflavus]|nr:hypothetical protein J3R82DRAFT_11927 [Butyriboletus roseoflavus]